MNKKLSKGAYRYQRPCPSCGSTDNNSIYWHEEEQQFSAYCRGSNCETFVRNWDDDNEEAVKQVYKKPEKTEEELRLEIEEMESNCVPMTMKDRKLTLKTVETFGVLCDVDDSCEIDKHYYPTYKEDKLSGYRIRSRDEKGFKCFKGKVGDTSGALQMFGQNVFPTPADNSLYEKTVMLVGGELDCMTGYQIMTKMTKSGQSYPILSVPSGENIKGIRDNIKSLCAYGTIILAFDNDEAGDDLRDKCCKLLPAGKVKIFKYPDSIKDLSQWWCSAKSDSKRSKVIKGFKERYWAAESYSPSAIIGLMAGYREVKKEPPRRIIPWPDSFGDLNKRMLGGRAGAEITNLVAASSTGKTSIVKESIYEILMSTDEKIGVLSLEETLREFNQELLSVHMSRRLGATKLEDRDEEEEDKAFFDMMATNALDENGVLSERIFFVKESAEIKADDMLDMCLWLVNGCGCTTIIVDPFTLMVSGKDVDVDDITSSMVTAVKRHDIDWINVQHVRKNGNGAVSNSEGAELSEEDIRGSGSILQTGMNNIIFTRNKVHENDEYKNTMKVKLSKCRRNGGGTGIVGYIKYDTKSGRLEKGRSYEEIEGDLDGEDGVFDEYEGE